MAKLSFYTSLAEKSACFNQGEVVSYYTIDNASQFAAWYDLMKATIQTEGPYCNFFRGVTEARYKLYNAAQRYWIRNNLTQVESLAQPMSYIAMIQNMVDKAKEVKLLEQVFAYYELTKDQQDFPLLSILQHYNAPTPLMDWTYDLDIALYFSIEGLVKSEKDNVIEDYISVYRVNKNVHSSFIINNLNYASANVFPSVSLLAGYLQPGQVVYISDFEIQGEFDKHNRLIKPLTTYYNLNILAQKGLFIFNPHENMPLEEFPSLNPVGGQAADPAGAGVYPAEGQVMNPAERPVVDNRIFCYNINKDLAELIRYRIGKEGINERFIYPELKVYAQNILTDYLKYVIG